ncbi:hypothetical protein J25TS5_33370 [Paenibacillus faecis]|uniref:RHS repeat-associated core domain-containing protein n=1 Tax=Paenibacillus faecis TaxID=862114 RepID=UPI001B104385|nr:RHS repeat-associated core domain-containing protein [Paenibacillus faecis]GIO86405.1 hypothetical protein J25TS5_33370 [Paenibacillus faecis]
MKKWISFLLSIVLLADLALFNGGYVSAEESAALPDLVDSNVPTVTSSVYDELLDKLSASLNPEDIITISSVVERFGVERTWVTAELTKGYKLSDIYQGLLFHEKGGEYQGYMDRLYPNLPLDPLTAFNQQSLAATQAVYGGVNPNTVTELVYPSSVTKDVYSHRLQAFSFGTGYDEIALKRQPLRFDKAPYGVGSVQDQISTVDGSLQVKVTDLFVKGANGMDFALTRVYDSSMGKDRTYVASGYKNRTEITTEEERFNLGKGWRWDLPYLKTESGVDYLTIPGEGTYALDDYELQGYPWNNYDFGPIGESSREELSDEFGISGAEYELRDYTGGTTTFFSYRGDPILITNRFGNYVSFSWGSDGLSFVFVSAGKGEIGHYLTFRYDSQQVKVTAYGEAGSEESVTYKKATVNSYNRTQQVLSEVIDAQGRSTKYDYGIWNSTEFNLVQGYENLTGNDRTIYWGWNDWVQLVSIEHPTKAITQYSFDGVVLRKLGEYAAQEEPRYNSRKVFYSTESQTIGTEMKLTYNGDIGENYGTTRNFSVSVNDGLANTVFNYTKAHYGNMVPDVLYKRSVDRRSLDGRLYEATYYTYNEARRSAVPIRIEERKSGSSRVTSIEYDNDYGLIMSQTDLQGVTTRYQYDYYNAHLVTQWLPTQITVPVSTTNSLITKYKYNQTTATLTEATVEDKTGKLYSQVNYEYDAYSNPTTIRLKGDTADTVVKMQYGYRSMLPTRQEVNVTGGDGTLSTISVQSGYNLRGDITKYIDGNGHTTTVTYDAIGRPTTETNPDGSVTTIRYDDLFNKVSVTDARGNVRTYEYDPLGRLIREMDARGVTVYTLDAYGRTVAKTDSAGETTTYTYDANDRVLTENKSTSQAQYIYNDGNRTVTTVDGENNQIRKTYDVMGRLLRQEELKASGNVTLANHTYDYMGNLTSTTDANGNVTTFTYDPVSQLIAVKDAEGKTTSYSYNMAGDMIKLTYADGKSVVKSYDEIGRLLKQTDPLGQIETFAYDHNGNLINYVDRKGQTHSYQYNNRNFLITDQTHDETITYTYDSMGNRLNMEDGTGKTSYTYAPTGELADITYPDSAKLTMEYDSRGIRTSQTFTLGGYKLTTKTAYQGAAALPQQLQVLNSGGTEISRLSYTYRKNNSLAQTATNTGLAKTYTYTGLDLTGLQTAFGGATLKQYGYGYDNNRNIISQNDNGTSYSYTYDVLNRIKTSTQFNETYSYDLRDNRSSLTSDRAPEIPTSASYQYDARNRLKNATVDGVSISYSYNGDGLMVGRTKDSETTRYYYDDRGLLVAEGKVNSGSVSITYGYVFDATGKLVGRQAANETGLQHYVTNGHGDATELRDASGNILNSYSYDIWGNPLTVQEAVSNPLRYSGEYWDSDTKLQYLRARWYDPATARFIGEDAYEGEFANPLTLNLYTYVLNNPLRYMDPTGHRVWLIHGTFSDADTWTPDFVKYVEGLFNESSKALEWTGKNSNGARSDAAKGFVKTVYEWHSKNPDEPIRLVGHSHGGNVAIMLANLLEEKGLKVETLITVATPVREYKLKTEVGQHIQMYNGKDAVQLDLGGRWFFGGQTFTRKFKGADNVNAKDGNTGNSISSHSSMHSNVDIWKKYIEPILKLGEHSFSGSRGSF